MFTSICHRLRYEKTVPVREAGREGACDGEMAVYLLEVISSRNERERDENERERALGGFAYLGPLACALQFAEDAPQS